MISKRFIGDVILSDKSNKLITIFTPSFNRCELLKRLYKNLCSQTSKNFIWLVIDDGSTDDTETFIRGIIPENEIVVQYIRKQNGGKHTAYNLACKIAYTELIFIAMDSDDTLKVNAVEEIETAWSSNQNDKGIVGMVFLCESPKGEMLYTIYNEQEVKKKPSLQSAYVNGWFWGEAEYIVRTDYARQFLYPEIENEKFFNEAYTYIQMDKSFVWYKKSIYIRDYQKDGLTNSFLRTVYNSPIGYAMYSELKAKYVKRKLKRLRFIFTYDVFSIIGKTSNISRNSIYPILATLMYFPAYIVSKIVSLKLKLETK